MRLEQPLFEHALGAINAQVRAMMLEVQVEGDRHVQACEDGTVCEGGVTIGKWCVENGNLRIDLNHS